MCIKKYIFMALIGLSTLSLAQDESAQSPKEEAKKPTQSEKTPHQQASDAAAREVGRVIGKKIGEDAVKKMSEPDRQAIIERARSAIRGQILRRYIFSESPYLNSISGHVVVMREGKDRYGFACKQIEIDLLYRVERLFDQILICQQKDGEWAQADLRDVIFPERGEADPNQGNRGGWLPPLP